MARSKEIVRQMEIFGEIEQAARLPQGSISLVGLELTNPDMKFEEWENIGRSLGHMARWGSWALGDWLLFGEGLYGEEAFAATEGTTTDRYDVANRITGLAHGTLANYASVCARIARSRRRVELFFSTHEPVASLDPEDQIRWLQIAVDDRLTKDELRQAIKDEKNPPGEQQVLDPPDPGGDGLSISERVEVAARMVYSQGQTTSDGSHLVPPEPWAQLAAALGEE